MDDVIKDGDPGAQGAVLNLLPPLLENILDDFSRVEQRHLQDGPASGGWELREETETKGQKSYICASFQPRTLNGSCRFADPLFPPPHKVDNNVC